MTFAHRRMLVVSKTSSATKLPTQRQPVWAPGLIPQPVLQTHCSAEVSRSSGPSQPAAQDRSRPSLLTAINHQTSARKSIEVNLLPNVVMDAGVVTSVTTAAAGRIFSEATTYLSRNNSVDHDLLQLIRSISPADSRCPVYVHSAVFAERKEVRGQENMS